MKRSAVKRLTPLAAKTELRRTSALNRSSLARSALHAESAVRRQRPKRTTAKPIPVKVRKALIERSGGWCEIAAPGCAGWATEAAHRVKRGMGGRRGSALTSHDVLSNLLHLDHYCHQIHGHRAPAAAYVAGWMLREHQDPAGEPVLYRGAWHWLGNDGSIVPASPTGEEVSPR